MIDIFIIIWATWLIIISALIAAKRSTFSLLIYPVLFSILSYVVYIFSPKWSLIVTIAIHVPILVYLTYGFLRVVIIDITGKDKKKK